MDYRKLIKEVKVKMNYKILVNIWIFVAISFIGFILWLTFFMVIIDMNIITQPLPTLVSLSIVIPMTILILSGYVLLAKLKRIQLKID